MSKAHHSIAIALALLSIVTLIASSPNSKAYFTLSSNIRVLHIEHTSNQENFYMRLPLIYSLGSKTQRIIDPLSSKITNPEPYMPNSLVENQLFSSLNPGLLNQENIANLILDYNPGKTQVFRSRGVINKFALTSHSNVDSVKTFLLQGIVHIIEGLDHVLFVLCLSLSALTLPLLFWRVTGFTIGHSITLSAGFFGFIPTAAWFIPLIETGITSSIIYVVWLSLRKQSITTTSSERTIFFTACMLGLLHGLGFSFVLHDILSINSPNIWQSLLAFNLGVEAGQILIILAIWPLLG